jgi:flagellar biosynthesis GTPase FlhF
MYTRWHTKAPFELAAPRRVPEEITLNEYQPVYAQIARVPIASARHITSQLAVFAKLLARFKLLQDPDEPRHKLRQRYVVEYPGDLAQLDKIGDYVMTARLMTLGEIEDAYNSWRYQHNVPALDFRQLPAPTEEEEFIPTFGPHGTHFKRTASINLSGTHVKRPANSDPFIGSGLDPIHNFGIEYEQDTGRRLMACCAQTVPSYVPKQLMPAEDEHGQPVLLYPEAPLPEGCWIQIDGKKDEEIRPYKLWYENPNYNPWRSLLIDGATPLALQQQIANGAQTGTAFLRADYYMSLDRSIKTLCNAVAPDLAAAMEAFDNDMQREQLKYVPSPVERLAPGTLRKLLELISLKSQYNAPQGIKDPLPTRTFVNDVIFLMPTVQGTYTDDNMARKDGVDLFRPPGKITADAYDRILNSALVIDPATRGVILNLARQVGAYSRANVEDFYTAAQRLLDALGQLPQELAPAAIPDLPGRRDELAFETSVVTLQRQLNKKIKNPATLEPLAPVPVFPVQAIPGDRAILQKYNGLDDAVIDLVARAGQLQGELEGKELEWEAYQLDTRQYLTLKTQEARYRAYAAALANVPAFATVTQQRLARAINAKKQEATALDASLAEKKAQLAQEEKDRLERERLARAERAKQEAEEAARRTAEEKARREAEEEIRRMREQEALAREQSRREAERRKAEEDARRAIEAEFADLQTWLSTIDIVDFVAQSGPALRTRLPENPTWKRFVGSIGSNQALLRTLQRAGIFRKHIDPAYLAQSIDTVETLRKRVHDGRENMSKYSGVFVENTTQAEHMRSNIISLYNLLVTGKDQTFFTEFDDEKIASATRVAVPTVLGRSQKPMPPFKWTFANKPRIFEWAKNSCWIDSAITSLFLIPGTPICQEIFQASTLYKFDAIAKRRDGRPDIPLHICDSEHLRVIRDFLLEDITNLQDDSVDVSAKVCTVREFWSECVQERIDEGKYGSSVGAIKSIQALFGLKTLQVHQEYDDARVYDERVFAHIINTTNKRYTFSELEKNIGSKHSLGSIIMHTGGHYYVYALDFKTGQWLYLNDVGGSRVVGSAPSETFQNSNDRVEAVVYFDQEWIAREIAKTIVVPVPQPQPQPQQQSLPFNGKVAATLDNAGPRLGIAGIDFSALSSEQQAGLAHALWAKENLVAGVEQEKRLVVGFARAQLKQGGLAPVPIPTPTPPPPVLPAQPSSVTLSSGKFGTPAASLDKTLQLLGIPTPNKTLLTQAESEGLAHALWAMENLPQDSAEQEKRLVVGLSRAQLAK